MINKEIDFFYGDNNSEVMSLIHPGHMYKTAEYSEELRKCITELKEKADKTYALVNALSAGEYYGPNRNGDYFPEKALREYHKTFEALAGIYKFHVNKDPSKSMGKVLFSFYNPTMHRVELILELMNSKAKDIIDGLRVGKLAAVSMGCRVPYDVCLHTLTPIFLRDRLTTLEDAAVGDEVFTHTGSLKKVLATSTRTVSSFIDIGIKGDYFTLKGTYEHPVQIVKKEQFITGTKGVIRKSNLKTDLPILEWESLDNLRVGDYLVFKKTIKDKDFVEITPSLARILGYYISEGFLIKQRSGRKKTGPLKIMGVAFSFSLLEKDTYVKDLIELLESINISLRCYEYPEKSELRVSVYSKELAGILLKYGGEYSKTKILHPSIFTASSEILFELLGSAINGDGSQDHNKSEGNIKYTTVSESLARSMRRLCLELGIGASINKYDQTTSFGNCTVYNVCIPASYSGLIAPYSSKVASYNKKRSSQIFCFDDLILFPIKSIIEINEPLEVKNLQIDGDESYQAIDYISHNCSICGNKAKTRAQYCRHLLTSMGKVLSNGQKIYAINTMPKFFDISKVTVGAEPTAGFLKMLLTKKAEVEINFENVGSISTNYDHTMSKAANLDTVAAITKKIEARIEEASPDPKDLIRASQKRFTDEQIEKISKYPLKEILSTFCALRIMPVPEDFQKIALYSQREKELADKLAENNYVFSTEDKSDVDLEDLSLDLFNEKIATIIGDDIYSMAMTKPLIVSRILTKIAQNKDQSKLYNYISSQVFPSKDPERSLISKVLFGKEQEPAQSPQKNPLVPLGLLGSLYVGYAKFMNQFGKSTSVPAFRKFMLKNPWLAPVFLVATATGVSLSAQEKSYRDSPLFLEQYKTAGAVDKVVRNLFITVPVSYYSSYSQEEKAQRGIPISATQNFIRKHPLLVGMAAAAGAAAGEKHIFKYVNKLKGNIKIASIINQLPLEQLDDAYSSLIK